MATAQNPPLEELIAGALDWWREAGVDHAYCDEPTDWLAQVAPAAQKAPVAAPADRAKPKTAPALQSTGQLAAKPLPRLDPAFLPQTLDSFAAWWMTEPLLADGAITARIAPRGTINAELMVIVPEPERDDSADLLSGPQGKLLDGMLAAFGLDPAQTYVATAIPRHLPGADWEGLAASGIGLALQKHIALAAPKRLAVFGASVLPLIGHAPPQAPADLRIFDHEGGKMPMLACRSLAALLEQPRWKARVWQAWLEMTG